MGEHGDYHRKKNTYNGDTAFSGNCGERLLFETLI